MIFFLSYNSQDRALVASIAEKLNGFGRSLNMELKLFFDQENLKPGEIWTDEIQKALKESDACIVFIGEQGVGKWQNTEALAARMRLDEEEGDFKLIVVILPYNNRENLRKDIPFYLADVQWIEFEHETDAGAFQKLLDRLFEKQLPPPTGVDPYRGLHFFDVDHAPFFFGRTFDINWIFHKKLRLNSKTGSKFLAIVGDSGSGKSSFARAGLLNSIKARHLQGTQSWKYVIFRPEDNPVLKLGSALQGENIIADARTFIKDSAENKDALRLVLNTHKGNVILLIDQFEEVITHCTDNSVREAFLNNLTEALNMAEFTCLIIITLRSDFYAAFSPYKEFADKLESFNYTISNLDYNTAGEEWNRYLKEIIQKPARMLCVRFDPALTNQMIEDCKGINGVLPVLQLALMKLWKRKGDKATIDSVDYDNLTYGKGIGGIIEEHANDVWNDGTKYGTDTATGELIKTIFIKLVEITSSKEDVRKTVNKKELIKELCLLYNEKPAFNEEKINEVLHALSGREARLIRIKKEEEKGNTTFWIEVVHEVLIRQWGMLRQWLNEKRKAIKTKNRLEQYIEDGNTLLSGKKLTEAEKWLKENRDLMTGQINNFIAESRASVNRKRRILETSLAAAILLILVVIVFYPAVKCMECTLVQNLKKGNYHADEVTTLTVRSRTDIAYLYCLRNLDTLILSEVKNITQATIDSLPQGLKQLSIQGFSTTDSMWRFEKFTGLKSLSLDPLDITSGRSIRNLSFNNLDGLTDLTIIRLGIDSVPENLQRLKSLRTLQLSQLDLSSLKGIKNLATLQTLVLTGLPFLESLDDIENLDKLQSLKIEDVPIPRLPNMEEFANMHTLRLINLRALFSLDGIEKLHSLRTLHLSQLNYLPDLIAVKNLKNLRSCELDSLPGFTGIENLDSLDSLQNLHLSRMAQVSSLAGIENLHSLQGLSLANIPLSSFAGVEKLTKLQTLKLDALEGLPMHDLTGIENFSSLQHLYLSGLHHLTSLKGIDKLTTLYTLHLVELDSLTDFTGIAMLKNLQYLHLSGLNHLSALREVENIKSLQNLKLEHVSMDSLSGIENLKNLRSLCLNDISTQGTVFVPALLNQPYLDTLILYRLKIENLQFLDKRLALKVFIYNDRLEVSKENGILLKAEEMMRTKFLNESIQ